MSPLDGTSELQAPMNLSLLDMCLMEVLSLLALAPL